MRGLIVSNNFQVALSFEISIHAIILNCISTLKIKLFGFKSNFKILSGTDNNYYYYIFCRTLNIVISLDHDLLFCSSCYRSLVSSNRLNTFNSTLNDYSNKFRLFKHTSRLILNPTLYTR